EPIINYGDSTGSGSGSGIISGPRPPSVPPPSVATSTPLLPRSIGSQMSGQQTGSHHASPLHHNHQFQSSASSSPEIAFGKHEKFIKLTTDLLERGHYSMMPNLGVGIYLTPGLIAPENSQQ